MGAEQDNLDLLEEGDFLEDEEAEIAPTAFPEHNFSKESKKSKEVKTGKLNGK